MEGEALDNTTETTSTVGELSEVESLNSIASRVEAAEASGRFKSDTQEPLAAAAPEPVTTEAGASEVAPPPAPAPTPAQYRAWSRAGREWSPEHFKTPQDWEQFTRAIDEDYEKGALRRADYDRKRAADAEVRRGMEQERGTYNTLLNSIADPIKGPAAFFKLAKEFGWNVPFTPEQMQFAAQSANPIAVLRQEMAQNVQALRAELEGERQQAREARDFAGVQTEWTDTLKRYPVLSPKDTRAWCALQIQSGMSGDEAARELSDRIESQWNLETLEKLPPARRDPIVNAWKSKYLKDKIAATNNTRQLSGSGGSPATTLTGPAQPKNMSGRQHQRWVEKSLEGRAARG